MLSKQIHRLYVKTILNISFLTLLLFLGYALVILFLDIDIVLLLLMFIAILMIFTIIFSVMFLRVSRQFKLKKVKIKSHIITPIEDSAMQALSFSEGCKQLHHLEKQQDQLFTLASYNFKFARIEDQIKTCYIVSTDDIEVIRD